jgi:hypothetical protein
VPTASPSRLEWKTSGGLIKLEDGSVWRVAVDHLDRTRDWVTGTPLVAEPQAEHPRYKYRLVDPATQIWVSATVGQDLERPWPR